MNSPFGWDLPPGCSHRDIDEHFGGGDVPTKPCEKCDGEGSIIEHELPIVCPDCKGDGEVDMTEEDLEKMREDAQDYEEE